MSIQADDPLGGGGRSGKWRRSGVGLGTAGLRSAHDAGVDELGVDGNLHGLELGELEGRSLVGALDDLTAADAVEDIDELAVGLVEVTAGELGGDAAEAVVEALGDEELGTEEGDGLGLEDGEALGGEDAEAVEEVVGEELELVLIVVELSAETVGLDAVALLVESGDLLLVGVVVDDDVLPLLDDGLEGSELLAEEALNADVDAGSHDGGDGTAGLLVLAGGEVGEGDGGVVEAGLVEVVLEAGGVELLELVGDLSVDVGPALDGVDEGGGLLGEDLEVLLELVEGGEGGLELGVGGALGLL